MRYKPNRATLAEVVLAASPAFPITAAISANGSATTIAPGIAGAPDRATLTLVGGSCTTTTIAPLPPLPPGENLVEGGDAARLLSMAIYIKRVTPDTATRFADDELSWRSVWQRLKRERLQRISA